MPVLGKKLLNVLAKCLNQKVRKIVNLKEVERSSNDNRNGSRKLYYKRIIIV